MPEYAKSRLDDDRLKAALESLDLHIFESHIRAAQAAPREPDQVVRRTPGNGSGGISGEVRQPDNGALVTPGNLSLTAKAQEGAGGLGVGASPPPPFGESHGSDSPDD